MAELATPDVLVDQARRAPRRLSPLVARRASCSTMMTARGRGPGRDCAVGPSPDARGGFVVSRGGPPPDGRGGPGRAGGPAPFDFDAAPVCGQRGGGFGRLRAGGTTMEQFAAMISGTAQRVVIDKTGLTGYYDIALTYTPSGEQQPLGPPPPGCPRDPDGARDGDGLGSIVGVALDPGRGTGGPDGHHRARARGARAHRHRHVQRRDRGQARDQPGHYQDPRRPPAGQAERPRPGPPLRVGVAAAVLGPAPAS